MSPAPELSIVVALISGKTEDLKRCLSALDSQTGISSPEILVPYDNACEHVLELAPRFPGVTFVPLEGIDTRQARAGASREHHDQLRTLGLRRARGEFVILTEDHAHAEPRWASGLLALLARKPAAGCVGGAVEWGGRTMLSYAVYLCDFGRYQNPIPEAQAQYVSDSNVCYRRSSLESIASAWASRYQETIVHNALARHGAELWLTPAAMVWQSRTGLTWGAALQERRVWGRSYAGSRVAAFPQRLLLAALTPALPFLLTWRLVSAARQKGRDVSRTLRALPTLLALNSAWALGELAGYLGGVRE